MKDQMSSDKQAAIYGYMMSLAVFISTMPIPIINLISNIIYFFAHRKKSYFIRWHVTNALLSQIPLFFMNTLAWYFVWNIIWGEIEITNPIIAFFAITITLNIGEIISSVVCCILVSNDKEINIPIVSSLAHIICRKVSWDKWERRWIPADPIYTQKAEIAKNKLVKEGCFTGALLSALFCGFQIMNLKESFDITGNPMESLLEEATYRTFEPKIVTNKKDTEPLKKMVDYLCEKNGMDSINVYLVKSKEVNAFAYAGRNLVVYTELVKNCDDEKELMSVLGHEIGHIEKKHVIKNAKSSIGISLVLTAFLGDVGQIASTLTTNHMSREREAEADDLAIQYLYQADIDPSGLAIFFDKLLTGTAFDDISILSDHPALQKRIDVANKAVEELEPKEYHTVLKEKEWKDWGVTIKAKY